MSLRYPQKNSATHRALPVLLEMGPMTPAELFARVDFGNVPNKRLKALEMALANGWLVEKDGLVDLSIRGRAQLQAAQPNATPFIGKPAAPRTSNAMYAPPLSSKYRINSRGPRADVPLWSVRGSADYTSKV